MKKLKNKPKKLRKHSKNPTSKLKLLADKNFSIWVRRRGAWKKNGEFWNKCYTSGKTYPVKLLQCGHFRSRTHNATRYHPDNARPQSFTENIWKRGNIAVFAINLLDEIGEKRVREVVALSNTIKKFSAGELEAIIKKYALVDSGA